MPTPESLERLEIIAENTQLGAGYSIAMRDLEMRGAGDLLGTNQHGYIASVGFHLYTRLLAEAVQQLKGEKGFKSRVEKLLLVNPIRPLVSVELPISVHIPSEYVKNDSLRLKLYRRIADIDNEDEIGLLIAEFEDRFGPPPEEVINLLFQLRVKLKAEKCGLSSISVEGQNLLLKYPLSSEEKTYKELPDLGKRAARGKNAYRMLRGGRTDWRIRLIGILNLLIQAEGKH